jgi:T5SS/PEP-CTERM-associated repeat protein
MHHARRPVFLARLSALVRFAILVLPPAALAQTTWIGTTTDWQTGANWENGVPTSTTDTTIGNANPVLLSGGSASTQTFFVGSNPTANLTISSGATLSTGLVLLGQDSAANKANVTLTGSDTTWTSASNFFVGDYGNVTVSVSSGATLTAGEFDLAWNPSARANVTVNGGTLTAASNGTVFVGNQGRATVTVSNGGVINAGTIQVGFAFGSGASGTLNAAGAFGGTSSLGSSAVTVKSDGTLAGNDFITGATTIQAGGVLAPDAGGKLRFDHALALNSGSTLTYTLGASALAYASIYNGGSSSLTLSGTVTLNLANAGDFTVGTYTLIDWSGGGTSGLSPSNFSLGTTIPGYSYNLAVSGSTLQLTASAIPEPSTYAALLGLGACLAVAWRRWTLGLAIVRRRHSIG